MHQLSPRYRFPLKPAGKLAGLFSAIALCVTSSAWSQQSSPRPQIGGDLRNGAASNLVKPPVSSSRTPMEVSNGVATLIGHYPESSKLRVVIGLTPPKMAEEEQLLKQLQDPKSPNFHKWLTAEQWNARFSPAAEDEQAVVDWAKSQGLTVTQRYPNRLIVDVDGTSGAIEKAFRVTLNNYSLRGATEFSNDRDPEIPANLANVIQSVGGLNSVQKAHALHEGNSAQLFKSYAEGDVISAGDTGQHDGNLAAFQTALQASNAKLGNTGANKSDAQAGSVDPNVTSGLIDPTDIYSTYGYSYGALQNLGHCCNPTHNSGGTPANTSIAVATAFGFQGSDITGFQNRYNYLAYHYYTINVDGTPSCCNDETTLDTEWSIATANSFGSYQDTSSVYVYQGVNNLLSTFTDVYNAILNRNETRVMTTSWGCQEFACTSSSTMDTDHAIFNSMIGQGWTLMAATGDQGAAAGCGDANAIQYPSSDPDIVAVGGTTLTLNSNGTFNSETGWAGSTFSGACSSNNGGSTGGCSGKFAAPSWQTSPFCGSGSRSVPDISLNAGAGQNTYFNGTWYGFGGTSIASPMVAGFFAQSNAYLTSLGRSYTMIGQGGPKFYYFAHNPNYASHVPFYDMTSGCNNNDITAEYGLTYFCAVTGYDRVTGWGSFNALQMSWAMNAWFVGDFVTPTVTFSGPSHTQGANNWYNTDQTVSWTVTDNGSSGLPATGTAGYSAAWDFTFSDPNSEPHGGAPNSFYSGPAHPNATTGSLSLAAAGQGCHYADVDAWDNSGYTSGNQLYDYLCYDSVAPVVNASLSGTLHGSFYTSAVQVTLSASDATSGVAHTYYSLDGAGYVAYSSPFSLSATNRGTHTVQYYSKDVAGNSSTVKTVSFTISTLTTTTIATSLNPSIYGQAVTFTAKVVANPSGAPTGAVNFLHGATVLGSANVTNGVAKLTLTNLAVGTTHINATYVGNTRYATSTSSALAQVINKASSTAAITSSLNPSRLGQAVTFKTTVTPAHGGTATGTVKFLHGSDVLGTATLAGNVASLTLTNLVIGTTHINASYAGDANVGASTSGTVSQVINKAVTSLSLSSSSNPSTHGSLVTFTVHVHQDSGPRPTGTITFKDGATTIGTATIDVSGNATFSTASLSVRTHSITASYPGNANDLSSTSSVLSQVVHN